MNWNNVNLNSDYERSQNILDGYSFDILLLEINCNIKNINKDTIKQQFEESLKMKIDSAREIFVANLDNIVKQAIKEREM